MTLLLFISLFFKASGIDAERNRSVFDKILYFRILVPYTGIIKNVSKNTEALICPESLFKKKYRFLSLWIAYIGRLVIFKYQVRRTSTLSFDQFWKELIMLS